MEMIGKCSVGTNVSFVYVRGVLQSQHIQLTITLALLNPIVTQGLPVYLLYIYMYTHVVMYKIMYIYIHNVCRYKMGEKSEVRHL